MPAPGTRESLTRILSDLADLKEKATSTDPRVLNSVIGDLVDEVFELTKLVKTLADQGDQGSQA